MRQTLAGRTTLACVFSLAALASVPVIASAEIVPVTNTNDSGAGSLREAMETLNGEPGSHVIDATQVAGSVNLQSQLSLGSADIVLDGPAGTLTLTRAGETPHRILSVVGPGTIELNDISITNGHATGGAGGGGVENQGADLTLRNVRLEGNRADHVGGAIINTGSLTVIDSAVLDNEVLDASEGFGGGIENLGTLTVRRSTIAGNTAPNGGGIDQFAGPVASTEVSQSAITGNTSTEGGALMSGGSAVGSVSIETTTIAANSGGGITASDTALTIDASTLSDNSRESGAAGANLVLGAGATATISSTIVADAVGGPNCSGSAALTSAGHNLESADSCAFDQATDHASANPLLGPLADNGGPTQTMAMSPLSPALDQAVAADTTDQRGQPRTIDFAELGNAPGGDGTDIGAYELQVAPLPSVQVTAGPQGPTNDRTPTFEFSATDAATVECSIDTGTPDFGPCSGASSHAPALGLADAPYTFRVRGTNIGGQDTSTRAFSVDATGPDTAIDTGPAGTIDQNHATFFFSASEVGASFRCSLDGGAFVACNSPKQYLELAEGSHTVAVGAVDALGNMDSTPASRTFEVDAVADPPPETFIAKVKVNATRRKAKVEFGGTGGSGSLSFECKLDSQAFAPCTSPFKTRKLKPGRHRVEIRSVDASGLADPSPAAKAFRVLRR
jgi:hypothetical protein